MGRDNQDDHPTITGYRDRLPAAIDFRDDIKRFRVRTFRTNHGTDRNHPKRLGRLLRTQDSLLSLVLLFDKSSMTIISHTYICTHYITPAEATIVGRSKKDT
jgi:hypothetical protein